MMRVMEAAERQGLSMDVLTERRELQATFSNFRRDLLLVSILICRELQLENCSHEGFKRWRLIIRLRRSPNPRVSFQIRRITAKVAYLDFEYLVGRRIVFGI